MIPKTTIRLEDVKTPIRRGSLGRWGLPCPIAIIGCTMKKWLIILCMLLLGCSPKMTILNSHGMPIPSEVVQLTSVKGIMTDFHFKRIYNESEDSEYPEYLPLEEEVTIPRDTKEVSLVLHIRNPESVRYEVTKCITVDGEPTIKRVYRGKDVDKVFQFKGPLDRGTKVELWATVRLDGRVIVFAGRALYKNPL